METPLSKSGLVCTPLQNHTGNFRERVSTFLSPLTIVKAKLSNLFAFEETTSIDSRAILHRQTNALKLCDNSCRLVRFSYPLPQPAKSNTNEKIKAK